MSSLPGRSLRELPDEPRTTSHALLLRGGFVRQAAAQLEWLPLGWRVLDRARQSLLRTLSSEGYQPIHLPAALPEQLTPAPASAQDRELDGLEWRERSPRPYRLGAPGRIAALDWLAREINTYRQLPARVMWLRPRFRTGDRSALGLFRLREYQILEALSLHLDEGEATAAAQQLASALAAVARSWGIAAETFSALRGDSDAACTVVWTAGRNAVEPLLGCSACGYRAHPSLAETGPLPFSSEPLAAPNEVATPGQKTIEDVAAFLGQSADKTLKAVIYNAGGQPLLVLIRGDRMVNEGRILQALGLQASLRFAEDTEIRAMGLVPGYAAPIELSHGSLFLADRSVLWGQNFIAGANRDGYHRTGINPGRDFSCPPPIDLALAQPGDPCPACGGALSEQPGMELAHTVAERSSWPRQYDLELIAKTPDGGLRELSAARAVLGLERMIAAAIEACHDDNGIIWPAALAPYLLHIVPLGSEGDRPFELAEQLYREACAADIDVLIDDRRDKPGAKFIDADLIGCPVRATVSSRSLVKGGIEIKWRDSSSVEVVPVESCLAALQQQLTTRRGAPGGSV